MNQHLSARRASATFARVLAGLFVFSTTFLAGPAPAAEFVSTYSEPAWRGPMPSALRKAENRLYQQLMAQRPAVGKAAPAGFEIHLTAQELADIGQSGISGKEPRPKSLRLRVGVVKALGAELDFSALADGNQLKSLARGAAKKSAKGLVWEVPITSKDATALRIRLTGFNLPEGAQAYVYSLHGDAAGPYTGKGPLGDGSFWTHTITGSQLWLQVHYSGPIAKRALAQMNFNIAKVAHIGPRFLIPAFTRRSAGKAFCSFNATCVENASCYSSADWGAIDQARGGVAQILFRSGGFFFICSGGLLNDTDAGSQIPYFLTANHCISKKREASSVEAFWQFSTPCGGECYDPDGNVPSTLGASIVSSNRTSDYTLLRLDQAPPVGSVFMGWTNQPVAFNDGLELFRISHPQGAPQAFSKHVVDTAKGTCSTWPRGDWIYSTDVIGATEGGSSGSPVLNAAGQVVGQLSGACGTNVNDNCDSVNNATVDGALAAYFGQVAPFLDPDGGGGGGGGGGGDTTDAHVASIVVSTRTRGPWTNGVATVTVQDANGNPVANATVSGTFTGDIGGSGSGVTDSSGVAVLESERTRSAVNAIQFCVDNISGSNVNYDSAANAESCDTL